MSVNKTPGEKLIATNPIAYSNYFIEETLEAGIALTGTEVKSLRALSPNLRDSHVEVRWSKSGGKAGFEAVPEFMRSFVQRIYVQGALSTGDSTLTSSATTTASNRTTPDFLIELYFPNNIIGSGKVAPATRSWGLDVTWEP